MKAIYLELITLISQLPAIKWIDVWRNQTNSWEEELPFQTPAVFIEFTSDSIETIGLNVQDIDLRINFRLVNESLADTHKGSSNQSAALSYWDLLDDLHALLQGTKGSSFNSLNRISLRMEENISNILQYSQTYNSLIRDYNGQRTLSPTEQTPTIEIQSANLPPVSDHEPLFDVFG